MRSGIRADRADRQTQIFGLLYRLKKSYACVYSGLSPISNICSTAAAAAVNFEQRALVRVWGTDELDETKTRENSGTLILEQ
ncbi:uncharacterized protein H6S33_001135 [Morchella sextelata]|uniref:uncharacterized protein n=1 Tax=Morchella sextelata TaxID=1174677 RepID=UPI001D05B97D|nr:uncharacterized protein H6S33_001135 [Morchella sextelata]KAH0608907.1 hypothetical protein H6S33_001135 [Morchella sextelata]